MFKIRQKIAEAPEPVLEKLSPAGRKLINAMRYPIRQQKAYSASQYPAGYHTLEVDGVIISGQRNPSERLKNVRYDWSNKRVLDVGCNAGGMLFELLKADIKCGVGVDYDPLLINSANKRKSYVGDEKLNFYQFDVDKYEKSYLDDLIGEPVDITLLLSVCMWIKNWKQLIDWCANSSDYMLFESNGSVRQQKEQLKYIEKRYCRVQMCAEQSFDDPGQSQRKLFLASK